MLRLEEGLELEEEEEEDGVAGEEGVGIGCWLVLAVTGELEGGSSIPKLLRNLRVVRP